MKKRITTIVLISTWFILLVTTNVFAGPNDVIKIGLLWDPSTMNMIQMKTGFDATPILPMHQALQSTNAFTGERTFTNSLSETVELMPNKKDIKIKMVKGNKFHTGDPVTAHDVKWTYEQCADPRNANVMMGPLDEVEEVKVLDDYSLIIRFYEPYAGWRELLWIAICSKKYYDKVGREQFIKHPVGSGPWRFVEWKRGESITLEADPDYRWIENVPYVDPDTGEKKTKQLEGKCEYGKVKFLIIPDGLTRMAMLETGELDLISDILPQYAKRLERNKSIKVKRELTVPSMFALAYRPDNYPIFKDTNFSNAFNYAINRKEIVDKIFLGEGYPMYQYASKSELGYDPSISYEFDPDKARELIQKSSYKPGTPILFTHINSVPNAAIVATLIQNYMKDVGVTIKLQQLEVGLQATYARTKDPREGAIILYSWAGGRDPSTRLLLTLPTTAYYRGWGTRKHQAEMDDLCWAQAKEMDPVKRRALLDRIHELLRLEPGGSILFGLNQIYAMRDWIDYSWIPMEPYIYAYERIKILK